jgi:hypothetical protein
MNWIMNVYISGLTEEGAAALRRGITDFCEARLAVAAIEIHPEFSSPAELVAQLERDLELARAMLAADEE